MKKERRIPSIIGIIILLVCVGVGVFLTQNRTIIGSRASGECVPVNPQVTNINDNSADISFTTTSACQISVLVNDQTFFDVKSQNNSSEVSIIHYFKIKHLQPQKKYIYSVIAAGQSIEQPEFNFTTSSTPSSNLPTSNLAWGKILNSDGKTPAGAIVYLTIPGAAPLSSFVSNNGNWSISFASSLNESKSDWFTPPISGVDEDIVVISDDGQITQATNNSLVNNPVPDIIIGINSLTAPTVAPISDMSVGIGQVGQVSPANVQKKLAITNPLNNESVTVSKPDFFGTSPLNTSISIFLDSSESASGQITSDSTGIWHWSPISNLSLGPHVITVKIQEGVSKTWTQVSHNFTVLASDIKSQPQYEASSSALPTIIPSITPIPTPEPTIRTAHPSVAQKPPVSGNTSPTLIIIISAVMLLTFSILLSR